MNRIMPRLGKKSLFLLCCAFVLGYHSILDLNISSLSEKGKSLRILNEGGIIGFVQDVVEPFLAALQDKFQDFGEANQVAQISSSPTPSVFEENVTTNSTEDARLCLWWCDSTPAPTPAPTYSWTREPEYLTSDVHCGRYFLFILTWWYETSSIDYELTYEEDNSTFGRTKSTNMEDAYLRLMEFSVYEYLQCRIDHGYYDAFIDHMHKLPRVEASYIGNNVRITCMDACTDMVMCFDLTVQKLDDECALSVSGSLADVHSDAALKPDYDYELTYEAREGDTAYEKHRFHVDTFLTKPVKRKKYGTWQTIVLNDEDGNQKENLEDLFTQWNLYHLYNKLAYNNICRDLDEEGRRVKCTQGFVSYLDVKLEKDIGFAMIKLKEFKNSLTELHIESNAERPFPDFSEFEFLRVLEINANEMLSGELPATIGGMKKLKRFQINSGGLEGEIPTEIGHLQQLNVLDLGNNDFGGNFPDEFYNMKEIQLLHLHLNKFTGKISTKIGQLNKLVQISFQNNTFSGAFPSQVNQLTRLKVFDLQNGGFSGPFPEITGLKKLLVVTLSDNKFSGPIPESIGALTKLEFLNLRNNTLTGTVPASLADCENLELVMLDLNTDLVLPAELEEKLKSNGVQVHF